MTAGELAEFLSKVPPDLPVVIEAGTHIERIIREPRGSRPRKVGEKTCDLGRCHDGIYKSVEHDGYISLWRGPLGSMHDVVEDAPPVRLHGHWSRAAREVVS